MNVKSLAGLALAFASFQAFAATDAVTFSGSVQRDSGPATTFEVAVPAGESSRLTLGDGTVLEFSAAASRGEPAQSVVRLIDDSGKELHVGRRPGNAPASKSFRYLICGEGVTFISPAPEPGMSACPTS